MILNKPETLNKVIAPDGCPEYLTPGKTYKVIRYLPKIRNAYLSIVDDEGDTIKCCLFECFHLSGQDWIIAD